MIELDADIAVIGAGFSGSLTALVLERIGLRPVLVERGAHPRFAIGESATPIADLVLAELAERHDLPRLSPLANYGTWQEAYPQLVCGLKRGFSYFQHQPGRAFLPRDDHGNELVVAASAGTADADTHWLRADFDHFLVREVEAAGIAYLDRTEILEIAGGPPWTLAARRGDDNCRITAAFLIDASGEGNVLARLLGIANQPLGIHTNSRAIYAHFRGVRPWHDLLRSLGARVADHPFSCDDAALHHVLDGGWMWVLRFNNGVTSAGFMLDNARLPLDFAVSAQEEWNLLLARYPSVAAQFAGARLADTCGGLRRTGRLQRRSRQVAGPGWAMLPNTASFLDALHSTGNAHTLCGIERLTGLVARSWNRAGLAAELEEYERTIQAEVTVVDQIVHGCYAAFGHFELFAAFAMFYFAAATFSEERRRRGQPHGAFLLAHDSTFRDAVRRGYARLGGLLASGGVTRQDAEEFQTEVAQALEPYNVAGLCDAAKHNMYPYPAG